MARLPGIAMIGASVAGEVRVQVTPPRAGVPTFTSWRSALTWCKEQELPVLNQDAAEAMAVMEER